MTKETKKTKGYKIYTSTIFLAIVSIVVALTLSKIVANLSTRNLVEQVKLENKKISNIIENDLRQRLFALERMGSRWESGHTSSIDDFILDTRSYLRDMPGLRHFEYIDKDYILRWYIDLEKVEEREVYYEQGSKAYNLLNRVRNLGATYISYEHIEGMDGTIIIPLYKLGLFDGFITVSIDISIWLKSLISLNSWNDTSLTLYLDNHLIYEDYRLDNISDNDLSMDNSFVVNGETFTIHYKKSNEFLMNNRSYYPLLIGTSIILLSILTAVSLFLYLKENNKVLENKLIQDKLEGEIKKKKRVESELREISARLTLATEAGRIGIWNWNLDTDDLIWNEAMYELYDIPKSTSPSFELWAETLEEEDLIEAKKNIEELRENHSRFDRIFKITTVENNKKYIHAIARLVKADDNQEMIGINWDITPIKNIEEKLKAESELQHILIDISNNYINLPLENIHKHINSAMEQLGDYVDSDRVYIFEYDFEANSTSNTYEWVAEGISAHRDELQNLELEGVLEEWVETHKLGQHMLVEKTDDLSNSSLKKLLLSQQIKTLLTVPMISEGNLLGFIGFDWVKDYHEVYDKEITLLNLFSQIMVNIILRSKSERELVESKTRLSLAINGTQAGLWDWYVQSGIVTFNERWANMVGYSLDELEPSIDTWVNLCHPDDLKESDRLLKEHFSGKSKSYEYEARMKHRDGHWIWVFDSGKVVSWDKDGKPIRMTGTHFDITERRAAEEKIKHMATHDYLTDLPTMSLALDRAKIANAQAIREKTSTAFIFLDLDGFKAINDNYGHDVGDKLLKHVATTLLKNIRESDTAARIGGDEFLLILSHIKDKEEVIPIAKSLLGAISEPIMIDDVMVEVGVSIGISLFPQDSNNIQELIKKADIAMYTIKKTTKNNYAFINEVLKEEGLN